MERPIVGLSDGMDEEAPDAAERLGLDDLKPQQIGRTVTTAPPRLPAPPTRPIPTAPVGAPKKSTRVWESDREAWKPPVLLEPVVRSTVIKIDTVFTRPSARRPLGSVKSLSLDIPTVTDPDGASHTATAPPGLLSTLKVLKVDASRPLLVVTYARGYDIDAHGENTRKAIWATQEPSPEDQRTRVKVGSLDPAPVDSFVLKAQWRAFNRGLVARATGVWIEQKPTWFWAWVTPGAEREGGDGLNRLMDYRAWTKWMADLITERTGVTQSEADLFGTDGGSREPQRPEGVPAPGHRAGRAVRRPPART